MMSAFNAIHFSTPLICFDVQDFQELENVKQAIIERKAILKEQGMSGGQQNKDAVAELLTVMLLPFKHGSTALPCQ